MPSKNPKVDTYVSKNEHLPAELKKLRSILLECGLTEELKWGKPCYTYEGNNVVVTVPLKGCWALLFSKGALLKDPKGVLTRPGENTQAGRWIKVSSVKDIATLESTLKAYIAEAIEVEKAGLKVAFKKTSDFKLPEELRQKLDELPALKAAFNALTPGRQRGYILYFSGAKQSATRASRIDKYKRHILAGKGLHDE